MCDNHKQMIETVKTCFLKLGLPVKDVSQKECIIYMDSEFRYADEPLKIRVLMDTDDEVLTMVIYYGTIPKDKLLVIHELLSRINILIVVAQYVMDPDTGVLILKAGLCITDDGLSEKAVMALLKRMLADSYRYARVIIEQLNSTNSPAEIIGMFLRDILEPCKCFNNAEDNLCKLH